MGAEENHSTARRQEMGITSCIQGCEMGITSCIQGCEMGITSCIQGCEMGITSCIQGCEMLADRSHRLKQREDTTSSGVGNTVGVQQAYQGWGQTRDGAALNHSLQ